MAQTGFTPIQLYSTSTAAAAPAAGNLTNSTLGSELAINITDGKLFYKDNANAVQVIGWKTVPTTAGGTGLTTYTAGDLSYYATGTTFTKLAIGANTTILTSTGSAPQWSATSGITVGTATNLAGGLAGSVPYQTGAGATTFLGIGASGRYLSSTGSAPQWLAPAALTETDDTNVTMTLGGTPSTALLSSVSMTLGWTGQLAVGRGGTGLSTLTANYVPYGNATSAFQSSANLQFNGTNLAVGGSFTTTVSSGIAINNATAGSFPGIEIQTAGTTRFFINATNGASYISSVGTNPMVFYTNSADVGRWDSSGNLKLEIGNLVIGTSGKGIDFSATAGTGTSELLADYEEGTWTPTQGGGLTVVGAFASSGTYTKIGRQVSVIGTMTGATSIAFAAGGAILTGGLPFNLATYGGGQAFNGALSAGMILAGDGGATIYGAGTISANARITFQFTYFV
jgi:hypothetical protein